MPERRRWLASPAYDLGWFVVPGALALVAGVAVGVLDPASRDGGSLGLWIAGVLLVDVAHVWASLYRTWLDPGARRRHVELLRWTPLLVLALGFCVHLASPRVFWGVLAYVAVFHFIKQQEGFAMLYLRAGGEDEAVDRWLTRAAIWATTALPVVYWHARLPRRFTWFMADDFAAGVPELVGTIAVWAQLPILLAFLIRRVQRGRAGHPMVTLWVSLTALSWNAGIVWFNDDRVFTLTNVFLHGVPYMALVWLTGGRQVVTDAAERRSSRDRGSIPMVAIAATFYGLLVVLAFAEETLWDRLVWHDHEALFGVGGLDLGAVGLALAVAVLTVPQATHYILDRYIWRVGAKNPELAGQLGLDG